MKRMEWLRRMRLWVSEFMPCGGRRSGEMRCDGREHEPRDSQLTLPGMALHREWTYGRLR